MRTGVYENANFFGNGNMHMMYLMNSHNNLNFDLCISRTRMKEENV